MRFLKGLLAFWLLVALVIAVLLVIRARDEDDRDGTGALAPPPLSCATLSDRARQCKKELLDAVGDFVEKASVRAGRSPFTAGGRRLALATLFEGAISQGEVGRECEAQRASMGPMQERLWRELERCWPERGCGAFVACLRRVAEAEEKAGRLPL